MTVQYIHQLNEWPNFRWDQQRITEKLISTRYQQGRLIGRMEGLGFNLQAEAVLQSLTEEVLKTSEIEGEQLDRSVVRSSLARHLGMDVGGAPRSERHVDSIVELMLDATQQYKNRLSAERLYGWHSALFPTGRSGLTKIRVGKWRDDRLGPMQVVFGPTGRRKIHFQAPGAKRLNHEMKVFLTWFHSKNNMDGLLKAAIAHLWFVTLHPFDDGNGRIARAIADMALARSEDSPKRFYSMSAQISVERKMYYDILESTQKGNLDVTEWLEWFLGCLARAFDGAESILESVMKKTRFWQTHDDKHLNARQRKVLNRLLDGFEGKLTSTKWASIAKCSQDTASRDISELIQRKMLMKNPSGGRSTSYALVE